MSLFPDRSRLPVPKVLYKPHMKGSGDFFAQLGLSSSDRTAFRQEVESLVISHVLDPSTIYVPAGERVQQIMVIEVHLTEQGEGELPLAALDERLGMYTLFCLYRFGEIAELCLHYKEPFPSPKDGKRFRLIRQFKSPAPSQLELGGRDLDDCYEGLVKTIGQADLVEAKEQDVATRIALTDRRKHLEKQVKQLKTKLYVAKSMRQQMTLKKAYQDLLVELEKLTNY